MTATTLRRLATPPSRRPGLLLAVQIVTLGAVLVGTLGFFSVGLRSPSSPGSPATPVDPPVSSPTPVITPSNEPTPSPTVPAGRKRLASPVPAATPTPTPAPATPAPVVPPPPTPAPVPVTPAPVVTPPPSAAPDYSRPGGVYLDVLTTHYGYEDWAISLLDTIYMLPADYYPGDLVDTSAAGLNGGYPVRSIVVADLRALADAARANGTPLEVVSGFRSHTQQKATFDYWVSVGGYEQALRTSARPGHSEHQLGTTLDFTNAGGGAPWEQGDWAATPAGAWMATNAWRYGFLMSYPAGTFAQTGYDYEPWHYRYVGRELAAQIVASGLTTREYLWQTTR